MTVSRLTTDQRLMHIEREVTVLHESVKLLHKMLKEQRQVINDFVVQKFADAAQTPANGSARPEKELFAFVCKRKFDKLEKDIEKVRKLTENLRFGLKAG